MFNHSYEELGKYCTYKNSAFISTILEEEKLYLTAVVTGSHSTGDHPIFCLIGFVLWPSKKNFVFGRQRPSQTNT